MDHIVGVEWAHHIAQGDSVPGAVLSIEVLQVERIRRQHALFLNAPNAKLSASYSPHRLWFRQVEGLRFLDPDAGFTDAELLVDEPALDTVIAAMKTLPPDSKAGASGNLADFPPPPDPEARPDAAMLLRTLEHRADFQGLRAHHRLLLEVACALFADPSPWIEQPDVAKHSVYRLNEVVQRLAVAQAQGRGTSLAWALEFSKSRLSATEWTRLLEAGERLLIQALERKAASGRRPQRR